MLRPLLLQAAESYDLIDKTEGKSAERSAEDRHRVRRLFRRRHRELGAVGLHPSAALRGGSATAEILRGADTLYQTVQVDTAGRIGVFMRFPETVNRSYTLAQAVPAGVKLTFSTIGGYLKDLKLVATPRTEAYKSVGSFIAIGQVFPSNWDWYSFLQILALLSIMLGVMNLLPIPALDGGHIAFTLYEMLTGKKPGDRFLAVAQLIGMALLLLLMFLAFGNDIGRLMK